MPELYNTGNEIIDALQGLQARISYCPDTPRKLALIKREFDTLDPGVLFGHTFAISSFIAVGHDPTGTPGSDILFNQSLTFTGEVASYAYLDNPDVPLATLAVSFDNPALSEIDSSGKRLLLSKLQVPVLAIESCIQVSW